MREILFRGKRTDNGEWMCGNLAVWSDGSASIDRESTASSPMYAVIPETVGQYTGLTDKNGKKIFEGDIIQFDYIGKNLGVSGIETVVFMNGKFGVFWGTHRELVCLDGFANTTLEVIGNIHDNLELLKGGAE